MNTRKNTPKRWNTGPTCIKGHDLSSRSSFRRRKNGGRECLVCFAALYPTATPASRLARQKKRAARVASVARRLAAQETIPTTRSASTPQPIATVPVLAPVGRVEQAWRQLVTFAPLAIRAGRLLI
jgi:hypothetical protein